ncbi:MAG: NnrU family protein [Rhizobacter sp.]
MSMLILGLLIFLGVHATSIFAPAWRNAQVASRGEMPWKGAYALLSLVGFALILHGYGQARAAPVVLYHPPAALRHVAWLLMLPVFPLLLAAYLPGRISTATKHPMLVAIKLWALAHLLANGTLASTVLFGSFLAWAVADRISLKRRVPRSAPGAPPSRYNDAIAVIVGLCLYAAFLGAVHLWLIGVSPR